MYKLIYNDTIEYTENVTYVRLLKNGVVISWGYNGAHGFVNKDQSKILAFADSPIADRYDEGQVVEMTIDEFMTEQKAPLEDALCEIDAAEDERISSIEDALCDLDSAINGGE